jgi:hypothetical protein
MPRPWRDGIAVTVKLSPYPHTSELNMSACLLPPINPRTLIRRAPAAPRHEKPCRLNCDANGFAFDPATGLSYTLSATGVIILNWLRQGCDERDLPARLEAEYGISSFVAHRDAEAFVTSLRMYKLI